MIRKRLKQGRQAHPKFQSLNKTVSRNSFHESYSENLSRILFVCKKSKTIKFSEPPWSSSSIELDPNLFHLSKTVVHSILKESRLRLVLEFNKNASNKLMKFTQFLYELVLIIIKSVPKAPEHYIFASNAVLFIFCNPVWDAGLF